MAELGFKIRLYFIGLLLRNIILKVSECCIWKALAGFSDMYLVEPPSDLLKPFMPVLLVGKQRLRGLSQLVQLP